jgi:hypothetical protein
LFQLLNSSAIVHFMLTSCGLCVKISFYAEKPGLFQFLTQE